MRKDELTEILDRSLRGEPDFRLPADFAQKVTISVVRRERWRTDLHDYFFLTAILVGLIAAASGTYYLVDKELLVRALSFCETNWVPVAFLFFTLNFVLFADKVLLGLLFNRWKVN
ncbi:MAG: hypothetical protein M0Q53_10615 [Prolixibacteraceae bacterium]|jgi:hypothetical protein|nr:hypothetical protein [Prolixibacteraceae bacterium]